MPKRLAREVLRSQANSPNGALITDWYQVIEGVNAPGLYYWGSPDGFQEMLAVRNHPKSWWGQHHWVFWRYGGHLHGPYLVCSDHLTEVLGGFAGKYTLVHYSLAEMSVWDEWLRHDTRQPSMDEVQADLETSASILEDERGNIVLEANEPTPVLVKNHWVRTIQGKYFIRRINFRTYDEDKEW
jgi:hypothetical protein